MALYQTEFYHVVTRMLEMAIRSTASDGACWMLVLRARVQSLDKKVGPPPHDSLTKIWHILVVATVEGGPTFLSRDCIRDVVA